MIFEIILYGTVSLIILVVYWWNQHKSYFCTPTNDADWIPNHRRLARSLVQDNGSIIIKDMRDTFYDSKKLYTPKYFDRIFSKSQLSGAELHMSNKHGITAHVFITFIFKDGSDVAISVKPRRRKSLSKYLTGLTLIVNPPEIIHTIATKRDIFRWRTEELHENIVSYKLLLKKNELWKLLTLLTSNANSVVESPEFYSLISNNCFTNIFNSINIIVKNKLPLHHYSYTFSPLLDNMLLKRGLIAKIK